MLTTFSVTNNTDTTAMGSLRWAIGQSNQTAGPNLISFNIATSGVQTIAITSALPAVTTPVSIDGTTEGGYAGTPVIELNGAGAGKAVDGLDVQTSNVTVKGLAINRFTGEGINVGGFQPTFAGPAPIQNDTIENDFLGTDPSGTIAEGNGLDGLVIQAFSSGNLIANNVISGNTNNGIYLNGQSFFATNPVTSGNLITGNLVGTDVTGKVTLGNGEDGLYLQNAPLTTVGGTTAAARNIFSGNGTGMELYDLSDNTVIDGNYVGTDITGSVALGNNGPRGFFDDNIVFRGISNSTIGGTAAGAGNVISGGSNYGIDCFVIGSANLAIQGNLIGTDATGTKPLGNKTGGILIWSPSNVTIGGTIPSARNVISGNLGDGISTFANGPGLTIQGNYIGTDITGTLPLGNGGDGINATYPGITIGGLAPGAGNIIANNGATAVFDHSGVVVTAADTPVLSNAIYNNQLLGIALNGGNNGQVAPVLTSAVSANTSSAISGTLIAAPGTYTLQFFSTPGLNPSGNAEGETLLATTTFTIVGSADTFSMVIPSGFSPGSLITSTATDSLGDTSEFSLGIIGTGVGNGIGPPSISVAASASSVLAGQTVTDTFTLSNSNSVANSGVIFSDPIPAGVTFVSGMTSTGVPVVLSGGVATAAIGTLSGSSPVTVSITLMPSITAIPSFTNTGSVSSTSPPIATGTITASSTTNVSPAADLAVTINGPTGSTPVGQTLLYEVTVTNNGPSTASGVVLKDTLPANVSFDYSSASYGPGAVPLNGILTDNYGTLASGASFTLTIYATAEAGSDPLATDDAAVLANESDPNLANNSATFGSAVTPVADVMVSVKPASNSVGVGTPLTYTVTVTNHGPSTATNVLLTETLPGGVTFVSASANSGAAPTQAGGTVLDTISSLAVNDSVVITINIIPTGLAGTTIVDRALVSASDSEPGAANTSVTIATRVVPVADLAIINEIVLPGTVSQGQTVTFAFDVVNNGPSTATGVIVNDILPTGLTFVSGTAAGGTVTASGGVVTVSLGSLLDGGSSIVTIVATATAVGSFTNISTVSGTVSDPVSTNNTGQATVAVTPLSDLSVVLSADNGPVFTGEPLTYTATVTNNGPSPATNVVFTDPLFAGASFQSVELNQVNGSVINGVVTQPIGTLAAGQSVIVVLKVIPTEVGTVTVTGTVKATEPDPNPANNTSRVVTSLITPYRLIEFDTPTYTANETDGSATITIDRLGDSSGDVTVHFSTVVGGNATPGLDYQPVSFIVDFPDGVRQATVNVPVLANPYDNRDEYVTLQLDTPTGGAILEQGPPASTTPTTAALQIIDLDPVLNGPTITNLKLIGPVNNITAIEVDTTGNLKPSNATNPANFTITALGGGGKSGLRAGTVIPVSNVFYNESTGAVTLTPAVALPANELFQIDVNGTRAGAVTDRAGNPINSVVGGSSGSDYVLTVARGTNLTYTDEKGAVVNLKLSGPGTLDIDRTVSGQVERLQVVGGIAKKTVITGSVRSASHRTTLESILGLGKFGSIKILTTPPFYVTNPVYPNLKNLVDAPAFDSLISLPPPKKTVPPVKAKATVVTAKQAIEVKSQAVHSSKTQNLKINTTSRHPNAVTVKAVRHWK